MTLRGFSASDMYQNYTYIVNDLCPKVSALFLDWFFPK